MLLLALLTLACCRPVVVRGREPGPSAVKVMTLNMEHGLKGSQRIASLIRRERPDILFFQEAGPMTHPDRAHHQLDEALHEYRQARSEFEVIAVRGTISETSITDIPEMPHERNSFDNKTILSVKATVSGHQITLHCAHLSPNHVGRYGWSKLIWQMNTLTDIRAMQFRWLASLGETDEKAIAAGDLNEQPVGANYATLRHNWNDAFADAGQGIRYTIDSGFPTNCKDYILYKNAKALKAIVVPDVVSDHRAIVAWFDLN